tara:strand:- start:811 stop:1293 length:483 start_codon:yes stop_codon:yes gene_type:complete
MSPREPCFIIKIFDISYLNLVNEFSINMTKKSKKILSEISAGELLDKITILEIKIKKIKNLDKAQEVKKEYIILKKLQKASIKNNLNIKRLFYSLKKVNNKLWNIEDKLRVYEKNKKFDSNFIILAREVYFNNDNRSKIKLKINKLLGSNIREVKQYVKY